MFIPPYITRKIEEHKMRLASAHMPLKERLRKGADCVGFLDGAPEPAADVADMLRKGADKIERLEVALQGLVDASDGSLSDVEGALHRARSELKPEQPADPR